MRASRAREFRILASAILIGLAATAPAAGSGGPNVVVISVDTLRADRLGAWGYARPVSPNIDRLVREGIRFTNARTVEPLTGPAMASMLTSRHPHEHGATRNALRIRPGLSSVGKILRRHGYATAAFVSNWTLGSAQSGLDEHFHEYEEVLTSKRWLGLFKEEAEGEDVTAAVLEWLEEWEEEPSRPFFIWAHYTDPHSPYVFRRKHANRLGIPGASRASIADRYDTEIAAADAAIGELLEALAASPATAGALVVFTSDHGESFGEHGAWGHGRNLWEEAVRIPLAITWPGVLAPRVIEADARLIDVAPTILGLVGIPRPEAFAGHDWTPVLRGGEKPPSLSTLLQAHRGAVLPGRDSEAARRKGLLELGVIHGSIKFSWQPGTRGVRAFDLELDPFETRNLGEAAPRPRLVDEWSASVDAGLRDRHGTPAHLDREAIEKLRSLGYLD